VSSPSSSCILAHVEQHPLSHRVDHLERRLELLAAVAAQGAEGVARQALAVHAHQHRIVGRDLALDQRHVIDVVDVVLVDDAAEVTAGAGGQHRLGGAAHQLLLAQPIVDEVRDGDDLDAVALAELHEIRHARHASVFVHDLADHARGLEPRQARQIHRALGLPRAPQHPALARAQRKHVAGTHEIGGLCVVRDGGADRRGAVRRGDARGDAFAGLDGDREGRAEPRGVLPVGHHQRQMQALQLLLGEREADEAAPVRRHEVDGLGRDLLRRDAEVALVLAVRVVDEDHHLAGPDILERRLHRGDGGADVVAAELDSEPGGVRHGSAHPPLRIPGA
jgi:hypothetical protein